MASNKTKPTAGSVRKFLDELPDENPGAASGVGNIYSQFSPFGFNGSYWYLRVKYDVY